MGEWKEGYFSEIADIIMGQSPKGEFCNSEKNGIPLLNGPTEFGIKFPIPVQYTTEVKKSSNINDILFCVRGSTTGRMNWANLEYAIGRGLASIRHKKGEEYRYFVKGILDFNLPNLLSSATGSTFPNVSRSQIEELKILIPPLKEQKAIAEVLSSLDDKIDLLHRQNKTLEKLAQTLFRQWFIEEADDEWEVGTLGEVVSIYDNKRVPLSKMQRDKMKDGKLYPYYGAAKVMDYVNEYIFDGEYILMGEDGTVRTDKGYPILQYATGKFWVNNHTHVLQAKEPYSNYFIWSYLLEKNIDKIVTGAVQPKINQTNLKALDFPKFPLKKVKQFNEQANIQLDKINQNKKQIKTLENLRDTLLPKLMSGDVRVKYD